MNFFNRPTLLWVDLEMSGLNPDKYHILQIACILTDAKCKYLTPGPQIIVNSTKQHLDTMDDWCTKTHNQSGLAQNCLNSTINVQEAEKAVLDWLKQNGVYNQQLMLAGNSVHVDRTFIKKYMPLLDEFLHYRILDVTSIKIMMNSYAPNVGYQKKGSHRALDDIKESINQYLTYTKYLFKE